MAPGLAMGVRTVSLAAMCRFVAAGTAEAQERLQVLRIFQLIDEDGSGTLEIEEVRAAVNKERSVRALLRASPRFKVLLDPDLHEKAFAVMDED